MSLPAQTILWVYEKGLPVLGEEGAAVAYGPPWEDPLAAALSPLGAAAQGCLSCAVPDG